MHSYSIDKNFFILAKELNFNVTTGFLYKEIAGTIVIISVSGNEGTKIDINLYALPERMQQQVVQNFEAFCKEKKFRTNIQNKKIEITISFGLNFKIQKLITQVQSLLILLQQIPETEKLALGEYDGLPVFAAQVSELGEDYIKSTREFTPRLIKTIGILLGTLLAVYFTSQKFPKIIQYISSPLIPTLLITALAAQFFKGYNKYSSKLLANIFCFIAMSSIALPAYMYVIAFASIPSNFRKTIEVANLTLSNSNNLFPQAIVPILFCILFALTMWNQNRPKKLVILSNEEYKKILSARNKISLLIVGFLGLGLAFMLARFFFHAEHIASNELKFSFLAIILVHITCSVSMYYLAKLIPEKDSLTKTETILASLFAPILISVGLFFLIPNINLHFSKDSPTTKFAIVSQFRAAEVTRAVCLEIIDEESGSKLPFYACERDDEFLKAGTKLMYQVKKGYFNNDIYINKAFIHPLTTAELLDKNRNHLANIRSTDIKFLLKIDEEKNKLFVEYFPKWTTQCNAGNGVSCRFASYIAEAKNNKTQAEKLLFDGCNSNDYTSCYGLRCGKTDDPKIASTHDQLTTEACRNNDLTACEQYTWCWRDDKTAEKRNEYKEVLNKLCDAGDKYNCNYLAWEKNRI